MLGSMNIVAFIPTRKPGDARPFYGGNKSHHFGSKMPPTRN